jgi:hypothetical protein
VLARPEDHDEAPFRRDVEALRALLG